MGYYVVDHMGKKYGPADLDLLNQWIVEGRLVPHMMLEDEKFGGQIMASTVPGLHFGASAPIGMQYSQPPQMSAYQMSPYAPGTFAGQGGVDPSKDARNSVICGILAPLGVFFCPLSGVICSALAIHFGTKAIRNGNQLGRVGIGLGIVVLVYWVFAIRGCF